MKKLLFIIICTFIMLCNYDALHASIFQESDEFQEFTNAFLLKNIKEHLHSNTEKTKYYVDILHKKATTESDNLHIAKSYFYYAYVADIEGNYQEAKDYIYEAINVNLNVEETKFLSKVFALRGKVHEQYGKDSLALIDFKTSLSISEKYHNNVGKSTAIGNIGKLRRKAKEYHQALAHFKKAYEITKQPDYDNEIARIDIIMGLGGSYLKLEQPDSALTYINKGIKRSRDYGDTEGVSYFYVDYGIAYVLKKNYKKALDYFNRAERIIQDFTNEKRLIEVYYYIAKCKFYLNKYEQSIDYVEKAISIINEENESIQKDEEFIPYEYLGLLKLLIKNHDKLNNTNELSRYSNMYIEIEERVEKKDAQIRNELFNFLTDEETLTFDELISKQEAYTRQNNMLKIAAFVLCGILIVAFILFYRNQQKKKARFRELNMKIAALKFEKHLTVNEQQQSEQEQEQELLQPKKEIVITDKKVTAILEALKKFEQQEHYLDTNCNLRFVAKKVKTNATYLSKIINTDKGMSFNEYITDLRIQYTLKRLQTDPLFRAYSVKSIAQEVGYKSADSFTKHFKNYTKLYPSYYIKNLKKNV